MGHGSLDLPGNVTDQNADRKQRQRLSWCCQQTKWDWIVWDTDTGKFQMKYYTLVV